MATLQMETTLSSSTKGFQNLLEPDRMPCMTKVWQPQIPNRKESYLSPEELKLNVLESPRIVRLIEELSGNDKNKKQELKRVVQGMLNEIGLTRSMPVIRWAGICLNRILKKICTGVYVNEESMVRVKKCIGSQPVLYLPSHRSYADFVLMSYICFAYDLEIPGIAAGMDFLSMVGVGALLRKTGAFFMRRSFATDKLYWHVFKEYMRSLVNVYHTGVEFFIEGTRSRSFKALTPKLGLLAMALEPLFMGEVTDVTIIPIGVAYEKPLEEQLFVYEMLGVPKPKESTMALFKALKILDVNHGSMYVNFGQPISAREYFGLNLNRFNHAQLPVHVQQLSKRELDLVNKLGKHVISQQQSLIVLTVFNVVSLYINYRLFMDQSTSLQQLADGVLLLSTHLRALGALVSVEHTNIKSKILDSLDVHKNILQLSIDGKVTLMKPVIANVQTINPTKLKAHNLSTNTLRNSVPAFSLQIYCNPCMRWLIQPAFVLLVVRSMNEQRFSSEQIQDNFFQLRKLFSMEFVLDTEQEVQNEEYNVSLQYLMKSQILSQAYEFNQNESEIINVFLSTIAPFLCCYLHVIEAINEEFQEIEFTEKELLVKVQQRVENGLNSRENHVHPYCLSLDSISIALSSFQLNKILTKTKSLTTVTYRTTTSDDLSKYSILLRHYCQLLPFNYLSNYLFLAKL
ncbi:hypothetical protein HA402_008704 [Bradysia odoriphaga]|nr:hypothetical protein HA402_008704 [Bradysia odoriphaga]